MPTPRQPAAVQDAVREVLTETAQGHAVRVLPLGAELTTQEAADVLGVSLPTLTRLLDEGRGVAAARANPSEM